MKTFFQLTLAAAVIVGLTAVDATAQVTQNVAVSASVASKAKLTVAGGPIAFADADPDVTPSITAGALTITVKARTGAAATPTLTVISDGDLISGTDTITIGNVTWTAAGAGMVAGTMNKVTAQSLGSWTGSGSYGGTQTYALANSWTYATGNYSATITYTLTVP